MKINSKKIKNLYYTLGANSLNFIMGFISGFVLPMVLEIDDFAWLKLFTFYISYVGLTHFGFLDGIYLKFGAYEYDKLPKEKFRAYFKILIITQVIEAIILSIGIVFFIQDENRAIVAVALIVNMIIMNLTTLFAFVHQFTKRFKLYSLNLVLTKLLYVIGVVIFIAFNKLGYVNYIVLQTVINILILIIYMFKNKELVFGKSTPLREVSMEYIELVKIGFFVLLGNFMNVVILGIDRIFVDRLFSLKDFAVYSFAYSLISLFYILLNSITTVSYPYLIRVKEEKYKKVYEDMRMILTIIMSVTLAAYFFIKAIVLIFLPKYIDSLPILVFLVPTVLYSAQINILISNYYKILGQTKEYTKNNIIALFLSFVTNVVALVLYKDIISIAIATLISFILWVAYSDYYFKKKLNTKTIRTEILTLIIISLFIVTALLFNWFFGFIVYSLGIAMLILLKYKKDLLLIKEIVKGR